MASIDNSHWRFFLALEDELFKTQDFVDFHANNENTFSIKYRSIILQACSEIEKMCKLICGISLDDNSNMAIYRDYLNNHHCDFSTIEIQMPLYRGRIHPWTNLAHGKSPEFWSEYTQIKHEGKLEAATLKNAIDSLSGLFALLLAWYFKTNGNEFSSNKNITEPRLFSYPGLGAEHLVTSDSYNIKIPGFE